LNVSMSLREARRAAGCRLIRAVHRSVTRRPGPFARRPAATDIVNSTRERQGLELRLRSGINDLGYIDLERRTLQTIDNRFGTRSSPLSQGTTVIYVFA